ncbi:FAD-dependent monooxygenase [Nocardia sp. NBC_00565]|uniref:FAD-dependent oxidoreductase n=1 Tax=Nocardia sp. NBC_00565 TaxID=2975993 RepID=UPI002E80206C|nr:NAD(P)/FAD-dependent oxidoreductase [Nocardia sp. NBC_00565]WUC05734.1 FAD-dependent monooxygenase [Nocardia sp. NBC_00565]
MRCDVAIVGGGVGGCALATRLATAGLDVIVLERESAYRDQVRGEALVPWGFQEAAELGLADVVLGADGASVITRMTPYDETLEITRARRAALDLTDAVPGAPGVVGVGHPELREALATAATKAGALVLRGVGRSAIEPGATPSVSYEVDNEKHSLTCRLVVGADGKNSATRTAAQIPFWVTSPRVLLSGMLVDDGGAWDREETTIGVSGRNQYIVIPRANGYIRLYVGRRTTDTERINGPQRVSQFLEAYRTQALPCGDALANATPAGPCATFPLTDAWTDTPVVPGIALIGDAAGWSNPIGAQGLSIALRDARLLGEALLDAHTWTPDTLRGYTEERNTRMSRLRFATALTDLLAAFGLPDRAAKRRRMLALMAERPELGAALAGIHSGPWTPPNDAFSPDILTTLALA